MAAGEGFKTFSTGDVLTAADVNGYLMQGVWVFADASERTSEVTSPQEGNMSYLKDTNSLEYYSGSAWVAVSTGLTSPLTTKGDIWAYSTTNARLGVGSNNQVLTADSSQATGLKWASSGTTLINTTSFSAQTTVSVDSVFSSTYRNYLLVLDASATVGTTILMQLRASGSNITNAEYDRQTVYARDTSITGARASNETAWYVCAGRDTGAATSVFVYRPQLAEVTFMTSTGVDSIGDVAFEFDAGRFSLTNQADGFRIFVSTGNITGTIRTYGLANS